MNFDYTGAEKFLAYLEGKISIRDLLDHQAYLTVAKHAEFCSNEIFESDVENALLGRQSSFRGLDSISDNLDRIDNLLTFIRTNEASWIGIIESVLGELFPGEDLNITVYPIIGYDMGIGMNGMVCMNCNCRTYLEQPMEFLFYIIHECVHVIYERHHPVRPLREVTSPADWQSFFELWVQNEGFAVYTPLHLRCEMGYLAERDYRVLSAPDELEAHRILFLQRYEKLQQKHALTRDEYLEICFGEKRITYRIGCELIKRIEDVYGIVAVQDIFKQDGNTFLQKYRHLIEK